MIAGHLASPFKVYVLGFMPGLAYIAGLEPSLYLPRRSQPRVRLPRSTVAIAMDMTTIYPFESPGGWHLIGRTPLWMFDQRREQPVFLAPGNSLTFERIGRAELRRDRAEGRGRHARLVATLVDAHERRAEGRPRRPVRHACRISAASATWRSACRPPGAMDRIGLTLANALAGNPAEHRRASRSASWGPTCWSKPTRCAWRWSARFRRR